MKERLAAWIMALSLTVFLLPNPVQASSVVASGNCGATDNPGGEASVTWELDSEGQLTISGTGAMADYQGMSHTVDEYLRGSTPLRSYRDRIINVVVSDGITSIGNGIFCGLKNLASVSLPDSVASIGDYAFMNCVVLPSINIPESVTRIGSEAFLSCYALANVSIPDNVTNIGNSAFEGCRALTSINIPEGVTSIAYCTFEFCTSLPSISIPDSVTYIGSYAFHGCVGLTTVTIPNSVTSIGYSAFDSCIGLTSVTIPDSVTSIGNSAFGSCDGLTSVTIGKGVTSSGGAFNGCSNLTNAVIADGATCIAESMFSGTGLTNVIIPDSVTRIEKGAFNGSTSLKSIIIPSGIKFIGADAFNYESRKGVQSTFLSDVYYCGSQEQWNNIEFGESAYGYSDKFETVNIHYANTVTFNPNGNDAQVDVTTKKVINGLKYNQLPTPTRTNHRFDGWFTTPTGGTKVTADTVVSATTDHTLYAHWTDITPTYSITVNGGIADKSTATQNTTVTITANTPASGKVFDKWTGSEGVTFANASASTTTFQMPAKNATVTANYKDTTYTLALTVPAFNSATYGYTQPAAKALTIKSTGNSDAAISSVALSGTGKDAFTLNKTGGTTVKAGTTDSTTYTIQPKAGLGVGSYTATVTVTYNNSAKATADVSFSVTNAGTVATPTFSPAAGSYVGTKSVTITSSTSGATIYYTMDGSTPTTSSTKYSTAISVTKTTTIKAIAVKTGYTNSAVAEAKFTITASPDKTFIWNRDNWNFNNSSYQGYFSSGQMIDQISSSYQTVLAQKLTNTEYDYIFNKYYGWIYDSWGGSCYGMSSLTLLSMNGLLPYSNYQAGATSLYQLSYPKKDMNVSSLITYYQLLQIKDVIQYQYRTVPNRTNKTNIEQIISLLNDNATVLIGFKKSGWGGHAILAYGYEYGSFTFNGTTYQGHIKICDPNASMSHNSNYDIYFNTSSYRWIIPAYSYAPIDSASGAKFNYIGANINEINAGGYLTGSANYASSDFVARIDIAAASQNRSIVKVIESNGNYVTKNNATDDIVEDDSFFASGEGIGMAGYNLYDTDSSYRVAQSEPVKMELTMDYGICRLRGQSSSGESIVFDKSGLVEVNSQSADYEIAMTFNNNYPTDWFNIRVAGSNAEKVSLQTREDGYLLSGNNLENISVETSNRSDFASASFTTSYPSVLIYEIDSDSIGVSVDTDGNGTYETVIVDGSAQDSADLPVVIESVTVDQATLNFTGNISGKCAVAIYSTDGKMLTVGFKDVSANAGRVSVPYSRIELPSRYVIKIMLLNDKMVPLYKSLSETLSRG